MLYEWVRSVVRIKEHDSCHFILRNVHIRLKIPQCNNTTAAVVVAAAAAAEDITDGSIVVSGGDL